MSWWGGGKSKEPEPISEPEPSFASNSSFESGTNFASGGGGGGGGMGGSGGAMAELQAAIQEEQQRAALQAIVSRLTDLAFTKCVHKPGSSLSSSEQSCINATVLKYFDTSEFVMGRLMKSQGGGGT